MTTKEHPAFRAWSHSKPPFPSTLSLLPQEPPKPANLKPHEVLIEVVTAALNPVDIQLANLSIFRLAVLGYPKGMGCDFAGRVLGKGKEVKNFPVGAEVMGVSMSPLASPNGGALSEIAVIDTSRAAITTKPPHLTWSQAAALPLVFLTAKTALSPPYLILPSSADSNPTSPDSHAIQPTVVVLGGSSSVGIHAIQLLRLRLHAKIIATCSEKNVDFVKSLGADIVIDYEEEDIAKRLTELRPKEGYVEIIDCVGGTNLLPLVSKLLSPRSKAYPQGGNYCTIVGDKSDRSTMGGSFLYLTTPRMVVRMLQGWLLGSYRYNCINLASRSDWLGEVSHLAQEGLQIPIEAEFDFEAVPEAYETLDTGRAKGKVVVKVKREI